MERKVFLKQLKNIFKNSIYVKENIIFCENLSINNLENQQQTNKIFSDKWTEADDYKNIDAFYNFQFDWFLKLYGFNSEKSFSKFLNSKKIIIDTGCGLGYKADWFARLSPESIVIGIDVSDSVEIAARNFKNQPNLFFLKKDIADTGLKNNSIDFTVCDQVIMHTEFPKKTFKHLSNITKKHGEFACYVYSKKALPRELIDDYFRNETHKINKKEMWEFANQLTDLGKKLSDLKVSFECPEIPLLGIKKGKYDIQRFIYWNFLKCFWKEEWGFELSKSTNFDWYAPSNAMRFSKEEFLDMANKNKLKTEFLHQEEACYSGRFKKIII